MNVRFSSLLVAVSMIAVTGIAFAVSPAAAKKPTLQSGPDAEVTEEGLYRVDHSRLDVAFAKPGVDYSQYTQILIDPLIIAEDAFEKAAKQNRGNRKPGERYTLNETELQEFRDVFYEEFAESLADGDYPVVTEPAAGTLRVSAKVVEVRLAAPVESSRNSYAGRSRTYTETSGSILLVAELRDAVTNELLAQAADRRVRVSQWRMNSKVQNVGDLRFAVHGWGNALRKALDRIHQR